MLFLELKSRLVSAPILAFPDFTKMFILDTDASQSEVGAVMSQLHDRQERVVAYAIVEYSAKLNDNTASQEKNYWQW